MTLGAHLVLTEDGATRCLRFYPLESRTHLEQLTGTKYRTSPIFSLRPALFEFSVLEAQPNVAFLVCDSAFTECSVLSNSLPDEVVTRLFFTLGTASVVFCYSEASELQQILGLIKPRSWEAWSIRNGEITIAETHLPDPTSFRREDFSLSSSPAIDFDVQHLLDELQHNLNHLVDGASRYYPTKLPILTNLASHVRAFVDELVALTPNAITSATSLQRITRQQRYNALVDYLIQINSSLAYVCTQALSGIVPILDNRCPFESYSLLGIGTALQALDAFGAVVANAFDSVPISDTIRKEFRKAAPFGPGHAIRDLEEQLLPPPRDVDALAEGVIPSTRRPHLFYFSGRLGFQEAQFSVTAAMQTLSAADTVRWSLMTLSHELMHAHVRELLGSLFYSSTDTPDSSSYTALFERYAKFCRERSAPESLADAVAFAIFNYCRWRIGIEHGGPSVSGDSSTSEERVLLEADTLFRWLRHYYRDINEVIVHVLDFHYFFHGNTTLYLDYLWVSWSTVPSVLVNIEHYLMRTVAAVGTKYRGKASSRFDRAIADVRDTLRELSSRDQSNCLLSQAHAWVSEDANVDSLRIQYLTAGYLADVTHNCIMSSRMQTMIEGRDDYADRSEDEVVYTLEPGQFGHKPVTGIVSLLVDRLRRRLTSDSSSDQTMTQYSSAWLFLAIASFRVESA